MIEQILESCFSVCYLLTICRVAFQLAPVSPFGVRLVLILLGDCAGVPLLRHALSKVVPWLVPTPRIAFYSLGMAFFEVALVTFSNPGSRESSSFAWHKRFALSVLAVLTCLSLGWLWYWTSRALCAVERRIGGRWLSPAVGAVVVPILLASYIASTLLFWRTGAFADGETLQFLSVNSRMLLLYFLQAEPILLWGFIVAVAGVSLLFCWSVWRRNHRGTRGDARLAVHPWAGLAVLFFTCDLGFLLATQNPQAGNPRDPSWEGPRNLSRELKSRTSPVISLCSSLLIPEKAPAQGELSEVELGPRRLPDPVRHLPQERPKHPVILIAVESLRHDVVGASHQGQEIMPNLNRLAREGRWFTQAYAQSTHSDYADPCLVSSLYPLRTRTHHYYSSVDPWPKVLIYDILKSAGYRTAIFSSQNEAWGNMSQFLDSQALDVFFDSRRYDGPTYAPDRDPNFSQFVNMARVAGKLDDAVTIDRACKWIREQASSASPFVIYLNLQSSHFPYEIPKSNDVFQPCQMDFEASFLGYPAEKVDVVRNAYFNALHYIDVQLGTLLSTLEDCKIRDETLLVVAGDNGEAFYENGHATHAGPPFEPAIHVALVMNSPSLLSPAVDPELAQMIDLCPTILGMLKLPADPCFQGIDLLNQPAEDGTRRLAFIHCQSRSRSEAVVCANGWKLMHDRDTGESRLHDLRSDPAEQDNLMEKEPNVARVLSGLLEDWRRRQLLYYGSQQYYGLYFPPRTPTLSEEEFKVLSRHSLSSLSLDPK